MSITTLAGVQSGLLPPSFFTKTTGTSSVQSRCVSFWYISGYPNAPTPDYSTANGSTLTSSPGSPVTGMLPFQDPVSGNSYLARLQVGMAELATYGGALMLADRMWSCGADNSGASFDLSSGTNVTIASPTWPARDIAGSTNGDGVFIAMEVATTFSPSNTVNSTISYTNSAGTSGRTGTLVLSTNSATGNPGGFYIFGLQAGDTGVRSVEGFTANIWTSGSTIGKVQLVAFRPIGMVDLNYSGQTNAADALDVGFPVIPNGAVPFLISTNIVTSSNSPVISGSATWAQG